jgi:LysR family transcriptional regulator, nod-box dependent transcriptional activator
MAVYRGVSGMHFRQLDLNLLVALDALLTERNITEAGRKLHVTQSAMSGSLARLREYFEDELLVQIGRKMVPTPLAESLSGSVREILLQIRATVDTRPEFDPATSSRRFSLMMSDYVSTVLLSEVLQRVERIAPHVEFEIVSNDQPTPGEALERGDIDMLIMPREFLAKGHPHEPLFTDGYACVVWTGNEGVGDSLSPEQYLQFGHVCVQLARGRSPVIDEWFLSRLGVNRRVEVLAMNFNTVPQYVVGTRRIATLHRRLAEYYCRHLPLRVLPCPFELPLIAESLQWHRYFDKDPGRAWLCGVLKEVANGVGRPG